MEDDFLEGLNPAQREAVLATEGPCLVVAGAGSGKTRVLTYRIAQLMRQGVKPWQIMALTFTNKAAKEMRERIANVVGDSARSLWMGTFHSMFAKILRQEAELLGLSSSFSIYDTTDSRTLIRQITKELQLDSKENKMYKEQAILSRISMAKNNLVLPDAYASDPTLIQEDRERKQTELHNIYRIYVSRCRQASALDFDDLLLYTSILFRDHPERLEHYQQKFRYILVDEFQDTNHVQYYIVRQLSKTHRNICVVGDDAQSIYSFRGAEIQNILNFQKKDYPECRVIKLERNYRSTQTIVNAANSIIAKNRDQIRKVAFSEEAIGERIKLIQTYTDSEEAGMISSNIYNTIQHEHCKNSDIAILYRTNDQSRIFEEKLRKHNIPYRIYGGLSFYQRKEVKDVLAYLRLTVNPNDDEALRRVINYPTRGIGETSLQHLQTAANEANQTLWHTIQDLKTHPLDNIKTAAAKKFTDFAALIENFQHKALITDAFEMTNLIINASGILQELKSDNTVEGHSRLQNVGELLNSVMSYVKQRQENGDADETITLPEFLGTVALLTDMDQEFDKDDDRINLMTVHASKGLEFDYVYLVGLEENLFPSIMSMNSSKQLEEERRLFYVAVTRAARKLTISFAQSRMQWGEMRSNQPSRFLKDIDPQYIEMDARMADGLHRGNQQVHSARHQAPSGRPLRSLSSNMRGASQQGNRPSANSYSSARYAAGPALTAKQLHANMAVLHDRFGQGRVLSVSDDGQMAQVDFGSAGIKNLVLKFANLRAAGQ